MSDILHLDDVDLRFGDWGPGYVSRDPAAAFGVVVLRAGDEFANHLHELHTESFLVIEGRAELWLDRSELLEVGPGDLVHARPGVEHFLRNPYVDTFRAAFVKTPFVDGDKIDADWAPEERNDS